MMKYGKWMKETTLSVLVLFSLSAVLTGCAMFGGPSGKSSDDPRLEGVVFSIDRSSKRILVIKDLAEEDLNLDMNELVQSGKYSDIYWVGNVDTQHYRVGQKVKVWFDLVRESFPMQTDATKIETATDDTSGI